MLTPCNPRTPALRKSIPGAFDVGGIEQRIPRGTVWFRSSIQMQQTIQYNVEINCDPCPAGRESQIVGRLRSAFPVIACRATGSGVAMRMDTNHPFADGALKDFADLVADTLAGLGIGVTAGVIRRVTRRSPGKSEVATRVQDVAASLTGFDLRPTREIPVLYFYKGLRFDLDVSTRLRGISGRSRMRVA